MTSTDHQFDSQKNVANHFLSFIAQFQWFDVDRIDRWSTGERLPVAERSSALLPEIRQLRSEWKDNREVRVNES